MNNESNNKHNFSTSNYIAFLSYTQPQNEPINFHTWKLKHPVYLHSSTYTYMYKKKKRENSTVSCCFREIFGRWSRCVRPIKQNPIKCFVFVTFFFHSLPPSLPPPPYPCPRCDRACALIDLPSNGSGHAALSHPPSPSPVCWPVENYRRTNNTTEGWRVVAACNTRPIEQFHVSIPEEMIGLTRHDRSRAARTGTRSAAIRPRNIRI